MIKHLMKRN
jgi:hypothetical protein